MGKKGLWWKLFAVFFRCFFTCFCAVFLCFGFLVASLGDVFFSLKGIQVCLQHGIWKISELESQGDLLWVYVVVIQKSSKRINSDTLKREPSETHPTKTGRKIIDSKVPIGRGFLLVPKEGFNLIPLC